MLKGQRALEPSSELEHLRVRASKVDVETVRRRLLAALALTFTLACQEERAPPTLNSSEALSSDLTSLDASSEQATESTLPQVFLPARPNVAYCQISHGSSSDSALEGVEVAGADRVANPEVIATDPLDSRAYWLGMRNGEIWRVQTGPGATAPSKMFELADVAADGGTTWIGMVLDTRGLEGRPRIFGFYRTSHEQARLRLVAIELDATPIAAQKTSAPEVRLVFEETLAGAREFSGFLAFDARANLLVGLDDHRDTGDDAMRSLAQDLGSRFGKILRLDVSHFSTEGIVAIPADNPLADAEDPVAREIWNYGAHQPQNCALDRRGRLWCLDRGRHRDQLFLADRPGNFGWPIYDADGCIADLSQDCGQDIFIKASYAPMRGAAACTWSLSGSLPIGPLADQSSLLLGERCSGEFVAVGDRSDEGVAEVVSLGKFDGEIDSMRTQRDDVTLVSDHAGHRLAALRWSNAGGAPLRWSQTGCFGGDKLEIPAPDVYGYEVNAALWTDGALKKRYLVLPPGQAISVFADGTWEYPEGSVAIKDFYLPLADVPSAEWTRVETRVLWHQGGQWQMVSYKWDPLTNEAVRLAAGESVAYKVRQGDGVATQIYEFPSPYGCRVCHGLESPRALGLQAGQLFRDVFTPQGSYNQWREWQRIGIFDRALPDVAPDERWSAAGESSASLERRARSYLAANCSHCHAPGGWAPSELHMDLRYDTPIAETGLCAVEMRTTDLWTGSKWRILPGKKDASGLYLRSRLRGSGQMPPLGSTVVDAEQNVLGDWIEALNGSCEIAAPEGRVDDEAAFRRRVD
jgi:uncharacterized repeat protein (TIGR03806 family)